ncbi:hypothetical protein JG687_00014357 [Phytophthora cactorum]|uniref:Conserved oligomeric Golgi complex subunit 6 n=1 Tax=Phytophthora cactorum TaxID=29920 RepID=A0A8T1TYY8_9STRA|nr:hypothetical protein JG687_00014357 [Phytophthora cactorum]
MAAPAPAALQARVHKLLGSRAELEATKALLRTLVTNKSSSSASLVQLDASETPTLATLRRNLRSSLEHQQLALAQKALDGLERTLEQVSNLANQVDALDTKCDQVHKFLETTKRETQQVQTEAAALAIKRDKVQQEWKQTRTFLDRYQLTEDEVRALYAEHLADEDMDAFFSTLERVQQVKADCKELVATGEVNCALELLDAVGKYQEAGFERLYQWTAKKCAEVDGEPSNLLHRAIALLSDRAEFYKYVDCGPNGIPRPIEMHAHDPVRYCGDMLAWVHQAIATESEFFRVLFDGDVEFSPSSSAPSSTEDIAATGTGALTAVDGAAENVCTSMVGRAFDGVARPLQVRVEQTLSSPHGIVIAYKLVHLLAFYHHKFDQLVAHADVARALRHCREAANEAFHRQFQQLVDAVAASAQDYAASLAATHVTLDVSHRLVALLEVFQTSLLPEQEKEADLAPLFDGVLPALELMCQRSVTALDPVDALVFRINNISCLQAPLARFPEVNKWYSAMGLDLERWLRDLSELQATRVLDRCRVSTLLQHIQEFQQSHAIEPGTSPADTPGLDGETISRAMGDFCAALMTLMFPQLDSLAQPALADKARTLTSATLAGTYAFIYEFVFDARHGYIPGNEPTSSSWSAAERSRRVVLQHSPEEIRTSLYVVMAVLSIAKVKEVTARAFEELQLPVGASEEQVVSRFRSVCLNRVLSPVPTETSDSVVPSDSAVKINAIDNKDERFQRQAVAYRFLCSLPLLAGVEYRAEGLLPKLRPLDPQPNENEAKQRASAMLDVSIASMERAQQAGRLPYTNFVLRVHYCLRRHVVRRRYSEFLALHSLLEAKLLVIPQLPERNWVYALRTPPAERARRLAGYLQRVTTLLAARGVFSLEVMAFLEIDVTRVRAEEEALSIDILSRASRSENIYFIVHSSWIAAWKRFVVTHKLPPGAITNQNLLEATEPSRRPKEGLVAAKHYRCVNSSTWRYWHFIYGGGPAIRRQTPSIYGQPACDLATLATLIQRLVRGFLARRAMRRARIQQKLGDPTTCQTEGAKARYRTLEARLNIVRQYVEVREFQTRHVAAMKIQRAFRVFLLRAEHALLLAESAVPDSATTQGLQHYDDRLALEELALVEDPALRLAHFLATMLAGVPLRKLRSRNKTPAWRLFRLDSIASELRWSSSTSTKANAMAFTDVEKLTTETPLAIKGPSLARRMSLSIGTEDVAGDAAHAVVATYREGGVMRELMLICEGPGEMEVLYFGLSALMAEISSRTADGATFVDGHGIIRKRVPHAKKLLREAHELLEQRLSVIDNLVSTSLTA